MQHLLKGFKIEKFSMLVPFSQDTTDGVWIVFLIKVIVQPVVELAVIERVKLQLNRIVEVVGMVIEMNTSVAVITGFSARHIHNLEPRGNERKDFRVIVTAGAEAQNVVENFQNRTVRIVALILGADGFL